MTPENSDGSDGKNRAQERENIKDGVLIFFPLALGSLIAFDLRISRESQPAARILVKKEIFPQEVIGKIADHFKATDEDIIKKLMQEIVSAVLKKLTETRPEITNETNVYVIFSTGPLVLFYREQSWKQVAPIIFNKIGEDSVVAVFGKLEKEERNNWLRNLVTGNDSAGIGTIWQREK